MGKCSHPEAFDEWITFKSGTRHIRRLCKECLKHIQYVKQGYSDKWRSTEPQVIDFCIGIEAFIGIVFLAYIFNPLAKLDPSWEELASLFTWVVNLVVIGLCYKYNTTILDRLKGLSLRLHFMIISISTAIIGYSFLRIRPFILSSRNG